LVAQDEGTVKQDQGTVQFDQVQLDYCHITSPISGRVGLRLVDPGNVVQSTGSTTLAVVTQMQPITVIFTIPEDNLGQVTPHLRQRSSLPVAAFDRSGQHQIASGTLLTVDNQIDTTTGTVKARSVFANKDGALYPNQFVNTRLLTDTVHHATLIPSSAIQHGLVMLERTLSLYQVRLVRPRIDLHERVALADRLPFAIVHRCDDAVHLAGNRRGVRRRHRPDRVQVNTDIACFGRRRDNCNRAATRASPTLRCSSRVVLVTQHQQKTCGKNKQNHRPDQHANKIMLAALGRWKLMIWSDRFTIHWMGWQRLSLAEL